MAIKTPKEIVKILNEYIIGQDEAKKSVAIALYNRYRRMQLSKQMQHEITPKNLLMAGPTGVGKTEIARRLASIVEAPFVKVEATKFTEVGYVGRDVESMVRDLVGEAVRMEEKDQFARVKPQATKEANKQLVRLLAPGVKREKRENQMQQMQDMMSMLMGGANPNNQNNDQEEVTDEVRNERMDVAEKLNKGLLEDREVTIEVEQAPKANPMSDMMGQMGMDMGSMLNDIMPKKKVKRTLSVRDAREVLIQEESRKMVDYDTIYQRAIERSQNNGIIFIDEIDKIIAGNKRNSGEVSREGVQRDVLPIVEGSTVNTKYGPVSTDHILFIAAGAFAESKPSDLIPELQGRFPIRVELNALTKDDFVKILKDPQNSLLKQYIALMKADGIKLIFTQEAVDKIAQIAFDVNQGTDNIGARRLSTILEKLLEDVLYEGPDMEMGEITITEAYVEEKLHDIIMNKDLTKFILFLLLKFHQ
ncbi:ATP-dependent protease ATPase subunit HslU [Lactobacillus helveticus]|nr:ATP-dependent protease ATPase subunit HslU [Lactobacillus helveticus]